ncbi:MAG: hypothetical protein IT330_14520 [Anaerolineae bacterium]|nr:hypothetical protein [Anaerolineae bacterium]
MLLEAVRCPTCGALVNIGAQDAFARCSYCGGQFGVTRGLYGARLAAPAGITVSAQLLASTEAARWLEESSAILQAGRTAAEARHQREMWRLEHEGALLSFWPLLLVTTFVLGPIFILVGGMGVLAGATFIISGLALSLRGWQAQGRLADSEEKTVRRFSETMAQYDRRAAGIMQTTERIQTQIEAMIGAM